MSTHYEQGREARLAGKTTDTCPFGVGGPDWIQWLEGWGDVDEAYQTPTAAARRPEVSFEVVDAPICSNCEQPGAHFVPPCFGDPGYYICDAL